MDLSTYKPSCICGRPGHRCVCGCIVPEAAPEAVLAGRCARTASAPEVLPVLENYAEAPAAAAAPPKPRTRIHYSSRFELQSGELAPIDSEAQLQAALVMEAARLRKGTKWKSPTPDDLDDEELELVGTFCEIQLTSELVASAAAGTDSRELCRFIRDYELDPSAQCLQTGQTALRAAAAAGHTETVMGLLELGVDLSDVDADGRCALWLACAHGSANVLVLLLDVGVRSAPPLDDTGASCAGVALRRGHEGAIVALFNRATGRDGGAGVGEGGVGVAVARAMLSQISEDDAAEAAMHGHMDLLRALRRYFQGSWGTDAAPSPLVGERVVLQGLVGRPELNSRAGVVTAWDASTDRYTVVLDALTDRYMGALDACEGPTLSGAPTPSGGCAVEDPVRASICVSSRRLVLESEYIYAQEEAACRAAGAEEGEGPREEDGCLGKMARGSRIYRDAAGLPRCDEFGYDPYGNPIWNACPRWLVREGSASAEQHEHPSVEQRDAVLAPAAAPDASSRDAGGSFAQPSPRRGRRAPVAAPERPPVQTALAGPALVGHTASAGTDASIEWDASVGQDASTDVCMDVFGGPDTSMDASTDASTGACMDASGRPDTSMDASTDASTGACMDASGRPDMSMDASTDTYIGTDASTLSEEPIEPEPALLAPAQHRSSWPLRCFGRREPPPPQPSLVMASSGSACGSDLAVPGCAVRPCAREADAGARPCGASEPIASLEPRKERKSRRGGTALEAEEPTQSATPVASEMVASLKPPRERRRRVAAAPEPPRDRKRRGGAAAPETEEPAQSAEQRQSSVLASTVRSLRPRAP